MDSCCNRDKGTHGTDSIILDGVDVPLGYKAPQSLRMIREAPHEFWVDVYAFVPEALSEASMRYGVLDYRYCDFCMTLTIL